MFPYSTGGSGFGLSGMIGGITKTLSIANQLIPIYQQTAPMIGGARDMFKKFSSNQNSKKTNNIVTNIRPKVNSIPNQIITSSNGPTFFK